MPRRNLSSPFTVGERVQILPPALVCERFPGQDVFGIIKIAGPSMCSVDVEGEGESAIVNSVLRSVR